MREPESSTLLKQKLSLSVGFSSLVYTFNKRKTIYPTKNALSKKFNSPI